MNRRDCVNSGLIIFGLLILAILVAQSRRDCEIPGSSWVPCIWGAPLKSAKGVVYTLYRNSPAFPDMQIHIATFDAAEERTPTATIARKRRLDKQSGVVVHYWCERGKFAQ